MNAHAPLLPHQRGVWRTLPFAAAAFVVSVLVFGAPSSRLSAETLAGVGLLVVVALASLKRPSERFRDFELLLPVVFLVAVALLRQGGGGVSSGYSVLVLIPVIWAAIHADRTQLGVVIAGATAVFVMPLLVERPLRGPDAEWRVAVLVPLIAAGTGLTVHHLLHSFAEQTLTAERRAAVLRARHAVARILAGAPALETTLPLVLDAIGRELGWPFSVFWRVHHRQRVLRPATVWQDEGLDATALRGATAAAALEPGECLAGRVWQDARAGWLDHPDRDGAFGRADAARAAGLEASIAFPVRHGNEVHGVVECFVRRLDVPEDELRDLLDELSLLLEQLIERAEHSEQLSELETMARTEELTGLPNRRAWEETLPRELARARRTGSSLCVALIDVDHFKPFNDQHGHLAGDGLLRAAARAWRQALRGSDFLARFGGDEFAAILPECSLDEAATLIERLRAANPSGHTCSIGVAQWSGAESGSSLVRRADIALYQAKTAGRDRFELATSP
jgi:diguanylate cyclase (GGDEF)-like protein